MSQFQDCSPDVVIEMQEMGIGVEEILQYAKGSFTRDEMRSLQHGLEQEMKVEAPPTTACLEVAEAVTF